MPSKKQNTGDDVSGAATAPETMMVQLRPEVWYDKLAHGDVLISKDVPVQVDSSIKSHPHFDDVIVIS